MTNRAYRSTARCVASGSLDGGPPAAGAFYPLPSGQLLVAALRVLVSEPVELGQPGVGGVALVDTQLLAVVAIALDEGAPTGEAVRSVQNVALCLCQHRDRPRLAAPGPGRLE
jgi:hypothetical protein